MYVSSEPKHQPTWKLKRRGTKQSTKLEAQDWVSGENKSKTSHVDTFEKPELLQLHHTIAKGPVARDLQTSHVHAPLAEDLTRDPVRGASITCRLPLVVAAVTGLRRLAFSSLKRVVIVDNDSFVMYGAG